MTAVAILIAGFAAAPVHELGHLSEKYESGGRGPGTVSTGKGDPGGVSYGTYQLSSKVGRADAFVKKYYPELFDKLKAGTPEFSAKWKELAKEKPDELKKHEHQYIRETHYDPQARKIEKETKIDVAKRSAALRDVVWSVAVQHGPATTIIVKAAEHVEQAEKKGHTLTDEDWIKAIYAERGRKDNTGKLVYFTRVSPEVAKSVEKRFVNELADALVLLKN